MRLSVSFKKQFLGMSKREAMAILQPLLEAKEIYAIDYYASGHGIPQKIYVNYGNMGLHFDKHSRRIVYVS